MTMKVYNYQSVEKFINERLVPLGYEVHVIEGSLVDGYVCVAPDDGKYHFLFKEHYLNAWSSGITMRKCRRLPKWAQKIVDAA